MIVNEIGHQHFMLSCVVHLFGVIVSNPVSTQMYKVKMP